MARPKADLPGRAALRALVVDGELRLRVTPATRSEGIAIADDRLAVRTRVKPQDGAANKAVEKLVAGALGVATSRCRIVRGATSRDKVLRIAD